MNTKAEEKVRTRSASKRAGSVGITKPNTVSPKACKPTPNKVKADPTPAKPPVSGLKLPANAKPLTPSLDTPVRPKVHLPRSSDSDQVVEPVPSSKQHPPSSHKHVICKVCSASTSSPNGVKDAAAQIKEDLLETRLTISRLNLAARHLILDPNRSLENLGEQAGRVASLCSKVEEQFDSFRKLLSAQYNCLSSKVDSLALADPSEEITKKIEAMFMLKSDQLDQDRALIDVLELKLAEKSVNEEKLLDQIASLASKVQVVSEQSTKMGASTNLILERTAALLDGLDDEKMKIPASPRRSRVPNQPLPPTPAKPYTKLTHGFLKSMYLNELKEWLDNQEFTQLGNREVLYIGDYDYWYGKVKHKAFTAPPIIRAIIDFLNDKTGSTVNSCLITRYADGKCTCPEHEDNEGVINPASDIHTLSIGKTRKMTLRQKTKDGNIVAEEVELPENSLLTFSRKSQDYFTHEIPADVNVDEVRYSLTFRDIKPFYLNSTCLIGDSNCHWMKFGSNQKMCFGKWIPGESIFTPKIFDIPGPEALLPYRNIIINVGINDLTTSAPLPPSALVNQLELKCHAIHQVYPNTKILLTAVLPTRSERVNSWVKEFNHHLRVLSTKHVNLKFLDTHDMFCKSPNGPLAEQYASKRHFDIKHLNGYGILTLKNFFKECVMSSRKRPRNDSVVPWCYSSFAPDVNSRIDNYLESSSTKEQCEFVRHVSREKSICESEGSDVEHVIPPLEGDSDDDSGHTHTALDSVSGVVVLVVPEGDVCESENRSEKVDVGSDSADVDVDSVNVGADSVDVGAGSVNAGLVDTPTQLITSDVPPQSQPPLP